MQKIFERFVREEHGNAVVDWVVLMTGVVVLGMSVALTVNANVTSITGDISQDIDSVADQLAG